MNSSLLLSVHIHYKDIPRIKMEAEAKHVFHKGNKLHLSFMVLWSLIGNHP